MLTLFSRTSQHIRRINCFNNRNSWPLFPEGGLCVAIMSQYECVGSVIKDTWNLGED